jgi:hypothetical protein
MLDTLHLLGLPTLSALCLVIGCLHWLHSVHRVLDACLERIHHPHPKSGVCRTTGIQPRRLILYYTSYLISSVTSYTQLILYFTAASVSSYTGSTAHRSYRLISNCRTTSLGNRGSLRSHWGNLRNCIIFEEMVIGEQGLAALALGKFEELYNI